MGYDKLLLYLMSKQGFIGLRIKGLCWICMFAYLVRQHIYYNIGEIHSLFFVGAQRSAAEARRAHVQSAHPTPADHRAMHCHTNSQQHPRSTTTQPSTLPVYQSSRQQKTVHSSPPTLSNGTTVGEPPKIHVYAAVCSFESTF